MNDFEGLLATDYGFKPSGKSAPMSASAAASSKGSATNHNPNFDLGSRGPPRSARSSNSFGGSPSDDRDSVFGSSGSQKPHDFSDLGDIFGGSARYASKSETRGADSAFDFDSMFGDTSGGGVGGGGGAKSSSSNSEPVYDKPVYDDDIFDGVPGLKSSSKVKYEDVFASSGASSSPKGSSSAFDDLLGGFGKAEPRSKSFGSKGQEKIDKGVPSFDDLIPGFGGSSPPTERSASETWPPETTASVSKTTSKVMEDPFVVPGKFDDPLEEISKLSNSGSTKSDNGRVFDDVDPFDGLGKSVPAFSSDRSKEKDRSASRSDSIGSGTRAYSGRESTEKPSVRSPDSQYQKKTPVDNDWDSQKTMFDMPTASTYSHKSSGQPMSPPSYANSSVKDETTQMDGSLRFEESSDSPEDIWLTVSEIPLYTLPTSAPPPSRPPPPRPVQVSKARTRSPASTNARRTANEYSSYPNSTQNFQVPKSAPAAKGSATSPIDELEDFATSRSRSNADDHANGPFGEELEMNSVAAAMKEAMDKAEAKFRHAKEVRERESSKAARSKEPQPEKDEKAVHERLEREQLQRERQEEEMEQQRLREIEREREEKEREQRRLEKERDRAREIEREREKARQAVERATREARERAAVEARARAERAKAERAAVGKANAEARERAERAAVQRAQAEARERAAAEAKERAEKAAAEARERANSEAKEREARDRAAEARARAERAAVERAAAEARERAAAEARERAAAAAARANQPKNENDLEAFFSMGRASSAPRPRSNSSDPFDTQFQSRKEPEVAKTYGGTSSNMRKASSTTNIVDDLSSIFGAAPSSGEFQDVEGETEERRRARLERHQRTQERAAKALAEKNERDLQIQRDQAERHRIAETLDVEIKRWAAGKEGNLRALLSTLQYVLWPECGWSPVSLTDMITAASVKKVYRKATLCIHPDKVQQKGANLQQKYIAEKVFDLLKEAWNKFNSEELF
ncbi:auxilin-related protein 2 isoform X1 [Ziziphus jujuba]|uniref:Auxilin-related protein 2 isoform X1 n=1 Tax=Ziziphus jujuba TaxID=326968 RepID=A0ABM3ISL7_ZIZJJ|nr:auxilin-related protein 2 isoform X1 [Ziziphus jujuba]